VRRYGSYPIPTYIPPYPLTFFKVKKIIMIWYYLNKLKVKIFKEKIIIIKINKTMEPHSTCSLDEINFTDEI